MRKALFLLILALIPGTAWGTTHTSYSEAVQASKADGHNMVIVFGADWCPHCRILKNAIGTPEVQKELATLHYYHVDTDKEQSLARQFRVNGIPVSKVITPDMKIIGNRSGEMTPNEFIDLLKNPRLW